MLTNKYLPRILILGQPKTGTTGLFFKIKNSLPPSAQTYFEPRIFDPLWLKSKETVVAKIIFQSNLGIDYETFAPFPKKILMARDPRDTRISGLLYSSMYLCQKRKDTFIDFLNLLKKKEQDPRSVTLKSLMQFRGSGDGNIKGFLKIMEKFILFFRQHKDYYLFKYEDLVKENIKALEQYLQIPLFGTAEVESVYSRVVRTKDYGDWKNWFTPEDVDYFRPIFGKYMNEFGYEDDWELSPDPRILPEHCSRYVERLVSEITEQTAVKNKQDKINISGKINQ